MYGHVIADGRCTRKMEKLQRVRRAIGWLATIIVVVLVPFAGAVTAQEQLGPLGHPPIVPLEQAADVIVVIKPYAAYSLHLPATIDRMIQGQIVRLEKGGTPKMIVHTRNTFTSPLDAGVPVKLYLKEFRDGRGHYIIGVDPASDGGQP